MTNHHSTVRAKYGPTKDNGRNSANCATTGEANRKPKRITKIQRIIDLLMTRPEGLNRFEAANNGGSCLNSTIAIIRSTYGDRLIQRWEVVPSRYCSSGVRVLRFWLRGAIPPPLQISAKDGSKRGGRNA